MSEDECDNVLSTSDESSVLEIQFMSYNEIEAYNATTEPGENEAHNSTVSRHTKRKRYHSRGEMPTRATPIATHPDYDRIMARIRQKGEFDRVCENPDQFTSLLAEQLRYYKHVTPGRGADHYFYANGFEGQDLRGIEKVAKAFLERAGLQIDHLLREVEGQDLRGGSESAIPQESSSSDRSLVARYTQFFLL